MNRSLFVLLVLLATSLMGSSFAVGKVGLSYVSPLLLVGIRFVLAGGIMALAVRLQQRRLPDSLKDWSKLLLIGACQTTAVMGCIFLSMRTIPAGETSILTFMNPLFVVVFGVLFMRLRYRFYQWVGVVVGFAGVFVTLGFHLQLSTGTVLGLGSAIAWAVATLLVKQWGDGFDRWVLTAYQMLFGGLLLLGLAFTMETTRLVLNWTAMGVILYLALLGSIVQFATWYYLLGKGDPGRTSAFLFLAPFFGVLSGWLILRERIHWYAYVGGLFIFLGIFLVNWTSGKSKRH
ncbi:DMT family transporter [Paenibacillus aurantiacus]|uniref:DMT family transporter n=1 Tax=Paenibacillus aurantiacus TaxID=1936118 RepID=A0ABV5KN56_9BACL